MNVKHFLVLATGFALTTAVVGQNKTKDNQDYMRSSLYTIIVDDHGLVGYNEAQTIKSTFFETPLPEKFNDHNLEKNLRSIELKQYRLTHEEINTLLGIKKKAPSKFGRMIKQKVSNTTSRLSMGVADTTNTERISAQFLKFFNEKNVANKIVAKWFNMGTYDTLTQSAFNMELIQQRGLYNASEFDKSIASHSKLGLSLLADAGENLIKNTFVVGIRFNYIDKATMSGTLKGVAYTSTLLLGKVGQATATLAGKAVGTAGRGYIVKATAFLYQLEWNEEIETAFYQHYYNEQDLKQFAQDGKFKLKYIGSENAWADVQSTTLSTVSENNLIKRATVRSIDNVIAKLQREYETFRTKTPLVTTTPNLTAEIGLKEGVEPGDKFEVLERIQNAETGLISYNRVGVIKAIKGQIWDNRFAADEEQTEQGEVQTIKATHFSGGNSKMVPGMLIRQIN
jgi:hypothetical protein